MKAANKHSREIRKATGGKGLKPKPGKWLTYRSEGGGGKVPKLSTQLRRCNKGGELSDEAQLELAKDKADGFTDRALAEKYAISTRYVGIALRSIYTKSEQARQILKGLFFETAIAAGEHTRAHIKDLTPMQSAIVAKTMVTSAMEIERHEAELPKKVDADQLGEVGKILGELQDIADDASV